MRVAMESFVIVSIISLAIPSVLSYFLQDVNHNSNDLTEIWTDSWPDTRHYHC